MRKKIIEKTINATDKFRVKELKNGDIIVEGWANRAVADRGKELIMPDQWILDNYKKNPVILFNHDKDKIVGKAIEVTPMEGGLWIKAKIAKSKNEMVSYVRDMVEEGILQTFSVGFDPSQEEKDVDGNIRLLGCELLETSIVTIPMNQDSTFGVSMKSLGQAKNRGEARGIALRAKGALVAAAIQEGMFDAISAGKTRDEILARAAEISNLSAEDIKRILVGDVTPVPEGLLYAFSEALGIKLDMLKKLNAGDVENEGDKGAESAADAASDVSVTENQENGMTDETEEGDDEEEEKGADADEQSGEADAGETKAEGDIESNDGSDESSDESESSDETEAEMGIVSLHIPKSAVGSAEEAAKWAEENGYVGGAIDETETEYVLTQASPDEFEGEPVKQDLGDGVYVMVAPKKSEEKACIESEEKKSEEKNKKSTRKKDGAVPAADSQGVGISPTSEIQNPALELAKQTNVLLGVLIEEIKGMRAAMAGLVKENTEQVTQDAAAQETQSADATEEKEQAETEELKKHLLTEVEGLRMRVKALKEVTV